MFDIGFFELLIVAVVGLLVIGPEQLPGALRTLGLWLGRLKRALNNTRTEFEQHIGADDIRRQLHNEEVMRRLNASAEDIERVVQREAEAFKQDIDPLADNDLHHPDTHHHDQHQPDPQHDAADTKAAEPAQPNPNNDTQPKSS